jgi:hypothetical protein
MASSSRRDGAGGSKGVTSGSPRKGRPVANQAAPADKPAGAKKRAKRETGVIAVKRAGVLPRQARAPRVPLAEAPAAPEIGDVLEEITQVTVLATAPALVAEPAAGAFPEAVVTDATEEMPLDELMLLTAAEVPGRAAQVITPEEEAPSLAEVVMPPLDVEPPPVPAVEPEPPAAASPASTRTGLGRLMARLLRWAGARAQG